ncbi:hypothetical protein EJD97_008493 [Solanum chilense]|uniref:Uncharacterized protein n=1 Tax=Solanum chilense TaxID=4083 RepID=A0A6N2BPC2_SOLCI|nr:hypothetical protein EJD97_008493 [Solanum chilense]
MPKGYGSNLGKRPDMNEGKFIGMESHDCNVFMETLLPITFRHLQERIWKPITKTTRVRLRRNWIICQAEALDGVQIVVMSDQIDQLTAALAELDQRRVAEQESMNATVQQIKKQVMNLSRQPTTSAPHDTDNETDEDDYIGHTP